MMGWKGCGAGRGREHAGFWEGWFDMECGCVNIR